MFGVPGGLSTFASLAVGFGSQSETQRLMSSEEYRGSGPCGASKKLDTPPRLALPGLRAGA